MKAIAAIQLIYMWKHWNWSNLFIHYNMYVGHSVYPTPLFCRWGGGGSWTSNQILKIKGGGLTGPQVLEGSCWERVGYLFSRGGREACNFHIKTKLKSEIFNDKKSLQVKMFFSVITKNSNWEILTKNLVTFKR